MGKTTAPLLSFGASGQIGKSIVYSKWRGVKYARQHVVPANPRTTAQMNVRAIFALLREMYKLAPALAIEPWLAFAKGRPFTGMNKWVGENVRVLNGQTDMNLFIGSPGAGGGLPPLAVTLDVTTAGEIKATFTTPAPPDGWLLHSAVAFCFFDLDPTGLFQGVIQAGEDTTAAPYEVDLTGLVSGTDYQVVGFLKWTKPDGTFAYSVGITQVVTTT